MTEFHLDYKFTAQQIIEEGRTTSENIETIRTWLSNLENKNIPQIQDEFIVLFLLSCENDIELTKNTVISYYDCKRNAPEIFDDRDMNRDDIKKALNTIHTSSIPTRTDGNDVVHYFKLNDNSYSNFDLIPVMKVSYMLLDVTQEINPPNGLIVVIDMKGFGLMHLTRLNLGALKKYFRFLQEGLPIKLKVIHILNTVYFIDKVVKILKLAMKTELLDLIKFHASDEDLDKLFTDIPKKCLPRDYGGDLPCEEELHQRNLQQFLSRQEFWNVEEEMRKKSKNNS